MAPLTNEPRGNRLTWEVGVTSWVGGWPPDGGTALRGSWQLPDRPAWSGCSENSTEAEPLEVCKDPIEAVLLAGSYSDTLSEMTVRYAVFFDPLCGPNQPS